MDNEVSPTATRQPKKPEQRPYWLVSVLESFNVMQPRILFVRVLVLMLILGTGLTALYLAPHITVASGFGGLIFKRIFGG